jgi:hypothetical protein
MTEDERKTIEKDRKRITILSFSPLHLDARVLRQVVFLSRHFKVGVISYGPPPIPFPPGIDVYLLSHFIGQRLIKKIRNTLFLPLGKIFPRWAYLAWYWTGREHGAALKLLSKAGPDFIHANDWQSLPVAVTASKKTGTGIVLDLHEYAIEMESRWAWQTFWRPMIDHFLRRFRSHLSTSITVGESIAERYGKEYGFHPLVVMNIPQCADFPEFRKTSPEAIRLIHHGAALPNRQLELMIQTLTHTDSRFTLHFMLIETFPQYVASLKEIAHHLAPGRVTFHPPVRPEEIVPTLSSYDIGFFLLPITNLNHAVALPNKFFEFITAGLAVCIGPSPEMAPLTQAHGFGVVSPSLDPVQVSTVLNALSAEEIDRMKKKSLEAREIFNAEKEMSKVCRMYERLSGLKGV